MLREILSIIAITAVIMLYAYESKRWSQNPQSISNTQKGLRITSLILLLAILLMIFAGDTWIGGMLIVRIIYWMICLALTVALIIITVIDIHTIFKSMRNETRNMIMNLLDPNATKEPTPGENSEYNNGNDIKQTNKDDENKNNP